jgi:prepilin-type N-terminal cleavage/methylation domain-containing protein
MHPIRSNRRRGLTLVELVIGMSVGLILVLGAGSVYLSVIRSYRTGGRKLVAQQESSLLATVLSRKIRVAQSFVIYTVPNRQVPADTGDGLALLDPAGAVMTRVEWSAAQQTLVDSTGARITAMKLQAVQFQRDPAQPSVVHYKYKVDDERGDLVDVETAVGLRN